VAVTAWNLGGGWNGNDQMGVISYRGNSSAKDPSLPFWFPHCLENRQDPACRNAWGENNCCSACL